MKRLAAGTWALALCLGAWGFPGLAIAQYAASVAITTSSPASSAPSQSVAVQSTQVAPAKLVGGGARINYSGFGSLLTYSYPSSATTWTAVAKDHLSPDPATVTAYAIGIIDPADDWDVEIFSSGPSPVTNHPSASALLANGFALTGGGCVDSWAPTGTMGNLLTASYPTLPQPPALPTWECRGKDHSVASPASITAYVIGIRPKRAGLPLPTVQVTTATSNAADLPESLAPAIPGAIVTGGGALAAPLDPNGAGQLLTGTFPEIGAAGNVVGWHAKSKDHAVVSRGVVTAFAINVTFPPPPPPLAPPQDPTGLTATPLSDGRVTLSWQQVANVVGYQISGTALPAPLQVPSTVNRWTSPTPVGPGKNRWAVASLYVGGVKTAQSAWPTAYTATVPAPSLPFLLKPAGAGSPSESLAHYDTLCTSSNLTPGDCRNLDYILRSFSPWEQHWIDVSNSLHGGPPATPPTWTSAIFADTQDLGTGRIVSCLPAAGGVTACWASNHGDRGTPGTVLASQAVVGMSISSMNLILIGSNRAFFGTWVMPAAYGGTSGFQEFDFSMSAVISTQSQFDSQGLKAVPNSCISCHGGSYDMATHTVVGASLLPLVPAQLTFDTGTVTRAASEESIRRINQIVLASNPAPAVAAQINALYNGAVATPGAVASGTATPPGWATQSGLYHQIIEPYCGSCHFAQRGAYDFGSYGNLLQNKAAVQADVCTNFTMPHSEPRYSAFWTDGGALSLPGLLSAALGYAQCR